MDTQYDQTPFKCIICGNYTSLDDAVTPIHSGRCICLGCYVRETESRIDMPTWLRKAVISTANQAE